MLTMNLLKKNTINVAIVAMAILFTSCNDWLDVTPSDEIRVDEQFSTQEGFQDMLRGVYIAMADRQLYGEHLIYGDIEFLAQNHNTRANDADVGFSSFNFEDAAVITRVDQIWTGLYNTIANTNIILDNIDARRDVFSNESDYRLMKGEALALRAFLHFDVLRLFGERYTEETNENTQIPYVESTDLVRYPHLPHDFVYQNILNDLSEAQALMGEVDPVRASYDGFLFPESERIYHLNFDAVLALKSRVFMNRGTALDMDSAYHYSNRVLSERTWSYTSPVAFEGTEVNSGGADPLLSTELIWALNVSNMETIFPETFGDVQFGNGYTTSVDTDYNGATRIYDAGGVGVTDRRYMNLLGENEDHVTSHAISLKFGDPEDNELSNSELDFYDHDCVPMLRMSEMLLNKAEAILEEDRQETIYLLEELRTQRISGYAGSDYIGVFNPALREELVKEYRKELFLEGQTFFTYKRLGYTQIPDGETATGVIDMSADNYQLPIPILELELGNQ